MGDSRRLAGVRTGADARWHRFHPVRRPSAIARHRHQAFIRFLNRIEREIPPDKAIHLIPDNCAAHKKDKVEQACLVPLALADAHVTCAVDGRPRLSALLFVTG